jgi:hypothetical protein
MDGLFRRDPCIDFLYNFPTPNTEVFHGPQNPFMDAHCSEYLVFGS